MATRIGIRMGHRPGELLGRTLISREEEGASGKLCHRVSPFIA
jgi:hypothetical protein